MEKDKSNLKGLPMLLCTSLLWGIAFVAQTKASESIGPFTFSATRYFLGALVLLPIALVFERKKEDKKRFRCTVKYGAVCGIIMFLAISLQQYGIQLSKNSGKAGFLTALYILVVPIFGLFRKRFPSPIVWTGIVLGIVGMYLLSIKGSLSIETGDLFVLSSTVFWAAHILVIDKAISDVYPITFSLTQFFVTSLVSAVFMLIFDTLSFEGIRSAWLPISYGGFISVGIGYTLQVIGQKYTDPVPASLALSMESVFAALSGAVLLNERLTTRGYIGCSLIFIGIILAQIPVKNPVFLKRKKK